jgi:aconitate hydratase 2/2-methylisocitrate dehydratase
MKEYMDFRDVVHATQSQMLWWRMSKTHYRVHLNTADQKAPTDWTAEWKRFYLYFWGDDTLIESLEIAKGKKSDHG